MFRMTCKCCGKQFNLADAKVDDNWNESWSWEPAASYCPHCGAVIKHLQPDAVDFARHINTKNILLFVVFNVLWLLGIATGTLDIIGPIGLAVISWALITKTKQRRHRVFGWFLLAALASVLFFVDAHV
jgi:hypothetical protein